MKTLLQYAGCVALALSVCGCMGGPAEDKDRPKRTQVSGTVTFKGEPVEGATVTLSPLTHNNAAMGITDAAGKYKLTTFGDNDGAVPGDYKVTVTKLEKVAGTQPAPGEPGYDPNPKETKPKHLLPEKYADISKSDLTANISETAKTDLDFKLE